MRRICAVILAAALLLFSACDTGPGLDLQLLCERFNRAFGGRAQLELSQFSAEETETGMKFTAFVGMGELIACQALPNGRIHTVSLTGLPDAQQKDFYAASLAVLKAFADMEGDLAERLLQEISVGQLPVLGVRSVDREGFRLSYAANEAGRYFRLSCLRHLPQEMELPTLREFIVD